MMLLIFEILCTLAVSINNAKVHFQAYLPVHNAIQFLTSTLSPMVIQKRNPFTLGSASPSNRP